MTIPAEIRAAAHLEPGDPVSFELVEEGVLLRPQKVIDATQAWFWSSAWQVREAEADADRDSGRFTRFESDDELVAAFKARLKPPDADS